MSIAEDGVKCFQCKGAHPYHPSTGHAELRWGIVFCGTCYRVFLEWLYGHLRRRWGKERFYDHAATSIRAGVYPSVPTRGDE